jgi:hypothetical protein
MLERLKQSLVEGYVGAIALGFLLEQAVVHFVGIFAAPVAGLISQKAYRNAAVATSSAGFPFEVAYPELIRALLLMLIWFALFRWLYLKTSKILSPISDSIANPPISEN